MKFAVLFSLFLTHHAHSQIRYDKIVQTRLERRSVQISSIQVRGGAEWNCTDYEDGNSYDGACLGGQYDCQLELRFPGFDFLGRPEAYALQDDDTFLDFKIQEPKNCQSEFIQWQNENLRKTITYHYQEELYLENYQAHQGAPCYQVPHIKRDSSLGLRALNGMDSSTGFTLDADDRYRVKCESLNEE